MLLVFPVASAVCVCDKDRLVALPYVRKWKRLTGPSQPFESSVRLTWALTIHRDPHAGFPKQQLQLTNRNC
jgi:hypothetical protein